MKMYVFVLMVVLQLINLETKVNACMGEEELLALISVSCKKERNNNELWQKVVDCHCQIEEKFLRRSNQAKCGRHEDYPKGTNKSVSLQQVFRNICGFIEGSTAHIQKARECNRRFQGIERSFVMRKYGEDVPCNITKCIRDLKMI